MKKLIVFVFSIVLLGSCQRDVEGCTDVNATNYNSDATIDDGSCFYPVTNIPDTAFEQALIDLGYDDIIDGSVVTLNIISVDSLTLNNKNISSLEGIADFQNLLYLDCYGNQLNNLDLSQNTMLSYLVCSENQLTNLDVSQNTALSSLYCAYNQLTNLDINNNSSLSYLFCQYNQLTSLDVSNKIQLKSIICVHNQLTNLDLNNCDSLQNVFCAHNLLTELDFSSNLLLSGFTCDSNQLTSLDLSSNINLTFGACFSNNIECMNLKNFNVSDGSFWAFDNPNLNCVQVDNPNDWTNWAYNTTGTYNGVSMPYFASNVSFSTNCNYPAGCF